MASEWKRVTISDVCELIVDCVNKTAPVVNEITPYKMLRTTNIKSGRIDREECRRVTKETFIKWTRRANVRRGDVILTREAPLGEVGYVDFDDTVFLGQRLMQYRANPALLEPRCLLYYFLSKDLQNQFGAHEGSGSTVSHIRVGDCSKFQLSLPPLTEQKAIASILGALDDKIELNRRMNSTLEAMARALFQSWFVDFDPVRAKLDGRKPEGMDKATAALFPDAFQESSLGPVPKGWEVKTLSDLTSLITKGTTPTQDDMGGAPDPDAQINYVRVNSIDEDGSVLADKLTTIPESVHAGVLKRSILMANDVLYTIAGTIGRIALAEDWLLPANTNQAVAIIRPELEIPSGFLMLSMRHEVFRAELHNNIVHAVQANLSLGMISKARVVVPLQSILQQLFRPIDVLLSQISANRIQSRTLATLRDTLLPKLLSGELSVAAVFPTVEASA